MAMSSGRAFPLPRGSALALALAGTLAACTPTLWLRDGVALDPGGTDWQECRARAQAQANRLALTPYPRTYLARDAQGRAATVYRPSPYPDRFGVEQEALERCLVERGYRREPMPAGVTAPSDSPANE